MFKRRATLEGFGFSFDRPLPAVLWRCAQSCQIGFAARGPLAIRAGVSADAVERFGESGLVELVTVIGYYCLICLTLNAFDIQVTERMTDPFPT
jgi:4-carboxymuconolactone decarboxylase